MNHLIYAFPAVVEPSRIHLLFPLAFLLAGLWLLVSATTNRFRLGGLQLFVVGLASVGLFAWTALHDDRRRFSAIEVTPDNIKIVRSNPDETLQIARSDIDAVTFDLMTFKGSLAVRCNLQLTVKSGRRFLSNDRNDAECKRYRREIVQALGLAD